ncbi:AAA family ATPase [Shewanella sp. 0m-4]
MIIEHLHVRKFRAFDNVEFPLGKLLTLIAGQNGTQKTTVLGILTQAFTIGKDSPLKGEKPLCGGTYRSMFADKFKLSDKFDKAKEHEWTLKLSLQEEPFVMESMTRDRTSGAIRFWQKGKRGKGDGYFQLPVIYLSLKRLIPIGEDKSLSQDSKITLDVKERELFEKAYRDILISTDNIKSIDALASSHKNTAGVSCESYDWKTNSAGQDNIGKILLAILSFRRLKNNYPNDYQGGIIAIDEIDSTLYPGSQIKLMQNLFKFAANFDIQFIATTHSLTMIKEVDKLVNDPKRKNQATNIFLRRVNSNIVADINLPYAAMKNNLNVSLGSKQIPKIPIYTEDPEAIDFAKAALGNKFQHIEFKDCKIGCSQFLDLIERKVDSFLFPSSIIILDGDVIETKAYKRYLNKKLTKNIVLLPGTVNPETVLAEYLSELDDTDSFWTPTSSVMTYTKQLCFLNYPLDVIKSDRVKAKEWYNEQKNTGAWGSRNASKVFKKWFADNPEAKQDFLNSFEKLYKLVAKEYGIQA